MLAVQAQSLTRSLQTVRLKAAELTRIALPGIHLALPQPQDILSPMQLAFMLPRERPGRGNAQTARTMIMEMEQVRANL